MTKYRLIEMRWIDAWNELYRIVGTRKNVVCQLPDSTVMDVNQCERWIQESVYRGFVVEVQDDCMGQKKGVVAVSRSLPDQYAEAS